MISGLSDKHNRLLEQQLEAVERKRIEVIEAQKLLGDRPPPLAKPIYIEPYESDMILRIYLWFGNTLLKSKRIERWFRWWFILPIQIIRFLIVMIGGTVDKKTYQDRWVHCDKCPNHQIQPRKTKEGIIHKHYCGSCQCWKWWPAELKNKNIMLKWKCPMRLHAGKYSGDWYRKYLEKNPDHKPTSQNINHGTGGCGGNKNVMATSDDNI